MNYFVKNIKINKLLHLQDFNIPIANETPHLILTGKNGSGKTILLNAIADFLDIVKEDTSMDFVNYKRHLEFWKNKKNKENGSSQETMQATKHIEYYQNKINELYGKVDVEMRDIAKIIEQYQEKNFIISFYAAGRLAQMNEPKNPTKPNLQVKGKASSSLTDQFLYFLSDLKIQEALARNEQQYNDADNIKAWFENFEGMLKDIYNDQELQLEFIYKDYSFKIHTNGKSFRFNEMSDGYIAAIDIIADLILKMQDGDSLTYNYQKQGIVLIDEIETHLHLELQRLVMPLLTRIFPNIQFIVTTHSPFVLSSMPNAVAYDLEHREIIDELTEYSYESLAEGYFGVKTDSSYMEMRLNSLKALLEKEPPLTNGEAEQLLSLIADFDKIPEAVSPTIVGEFMRLKVEYSGKIKALQK